MRACISDGSFLTSTPIFNGRTRNFFGISPSQSPKDALEDLKKELFQESLKHKCSSPCSINPVKKKRVRFSVETKGTLTKTPSLLKKSAIHNDKHDDGYANSLNYETSTSQSKGTLTKTPLLKKSAIHNDKCDSGYATSLSYETSTSKNFTIQTPSVKETEQSVAESLIAKLIFKNKGFTSPLREILVLNSQTSEQSLDPLVEPSSLSTMNLSHIEEETDFKHETPCAKKILLNSLKSKKVEEESSISVVTDLTNSYSYDENSLNSETLNDSLQIKKAISGNSFLRLPNSSPDHPSLVRVSKCHEFNFFANLCSNSNFLKDDFHNNNASEYKIEFSALEAVYLFYFYLSLKMNSPFSMDNLKVSHFLKMKWLDCKHLIQDHDDNDFIAWRKKLERICDSGIISNQEKIREGLTNLEHEVKMVQQTSRKGGKFARCPKCSSPSIKIDHSSTLYNCTRILCDYEFCGNCEDKYSCMHICNSTSVKYDNSYKRLKRLLIV
ncbi:hypothetical protein CEXT_545581 [Caerostris extrusa]|uniref:RING-type domain-containing protein n=1 Tax=Caerostris extrusa TaxID=172846 RepID=A0AAV4NEE3_CAEEX|nr:hypothetical protein CEXT_545581 [Caerostris extrusa]